MESRAQGDSGAEGGVTGADGGLSGAEGGLLGAQGGDSGAQGGDSGAREGGGGDVEMPMPVDCAFLRESSAKMKLTPRRNGSRTDELRQEEAQTKKMAKYWECLKNHAASMGGHALDGCGEFMAAGPEGTADFLKCATCDCHRNFHRREDDGTPSCGCRHVCNGRRPTSGRAAQTLHTHSAPLPPVTTATTATSNGPCATSKSPIDSDDQEVGTSASARAMKKRFRTKFSNEQRERMRSFAEKLGWRIDKHQEAAVQVFCTEVGVRRHLFKVWMHNNKKTFRTSDPTGDDNAEQPMLLEAKPETPEPKPETSEPKSETSEP